MGFWRRFSDRFRAVVAATTGAFDSPPKPVDQVIMEMIRGSATRVGRAEALGVPYVQRGRNLLCSISTLPLVQYNRANAVVRNPLLEQFDPDIANVVHLAQTVEDLVFEGIAWWRVTGFGPGLFPSRVRRLDPGTVSVDPPSDRSPAPLPSGIDPREPGVWVDGEFVEADQIIRFDSPNPALLKVGGRSVRLAILLAKAAGVYADDPRPLDYFTPADGADPVDDKEVQNILAQWKYERKRRGTAYVPAALKYNTVDSPSPQQLQLVELLRQAGLEIANMLGIDPEDLGISTTSRTYFNATDRRQGRVNDVLAPYMRAIADRLSMGDVTPRGNVVRFDLTEYMRADPITRVQYYQALKAMGAITTDEIREAEKLPPMPADEQPEPPTQTDEPDGDPTVQQPESVDAARPPLTVVFSGEGPTQFVDVPVRQFTVDSKRRIIEGLALPYGAASASKYGYRFRFLRGSLKWSSVNRVKVMRDHNMSNPIGVAQSLTDMAAGLKVRLKVARGAEGDRVLELAEDGVLDGMSVGVDFDMSSDVEMDPNDDGVMIVRRADLREISLTAVPAFDDARVTKVTASRNQGVSTMDECVTCGQRHAPGVACSSQPPQNTTPDPAQPAGLTLSNEQLTALLTRPGALDALVQAQQQTQQPAQTAPEGGLMLSADQLDALVRSGRLGVLLGLPQTAPQAQPEPERREIVDPTRRLSASVTREELPYRFDRKGNLTRGTKYDFSTDIIAGLRDGDGEALRRAERFVTGQFVTVSDAGPLNPNIQRPDLYVDQQDFTYPMWGAIEKGTLADATPFVLPKFSSSSGLVAAHTEGVEPGAGTFVATSQTITPSAVSGKVPITREAWDQGGNPQLSGLIWNQMLRAWFEALEASVFTLLEGVAPTTITLTTGATNSTLVSQLEDELAKLQFVRGGFRMRDFFTQIDLYTKLIGAVDSNGKKLLPRIGPTNVSGTTSDFFADVIVGGLRGQPAWALAASGSVAANSYLFDRKDVSGWATAPNRLTFENVEVRFVHIGIWGYKALAVTDLTGVRRISYDPVV